MRYRQYLVGKNSGDLLICIEMIEKSRVDYNFSGTTPRPRPDAVVLENDHLPVESRGPTERLLGPAGKVGVDGADNLGKESVDANARLMICRENDRGVLLLETEEVGLGGHADEPVGPVHAVGATCEGHSLDVVHTGYGANPHIVLEFCDLG